MKCISIDKSTVVNDKFMNKAMKNEMKVAEMKNRTHFIQKAMNYGVISCAAAIAQCHDTIIVI